MSKLQGRGSGSSRSAAVRPDQPQQFGISGGFCAIHGLRLALRTQPRSRCTHSPCRRQRARIVVASCAPEAREKLILLASSVAVLL